MSGAYGPGEQIQSIRKLLLKSGKTLALFVSHNCEWSYAGKDGCDSGSHQCQLKNKPDKRGKEHCGNDDQQEGSDLHLDGSLLEEYLKPWDKRQFYENAM